MTDLIFILDRSGSMKKQAKTTIKEYNSYIENMEVENIKVTTVLFDDEYEMITRRKDVDEVKKLTKEIYYPRGCTALYDAIGKTIKYMDEEETQKVIFIIITDGLENCSIRYSKDKIKSMIYRHSNWEFIYLGADIDSFNEGTNIGIDEKNISNFGKGNKGTHNLFKSIKKAVDMICEDAFVSKDWKDDSEEYNKNNS